MSTWKRLIRSSLLMALALLLWLLTKSLLWVPCLLAAIFFFFVDVLRIDMSSGKSLDMETQRAGRPLGVLDRYIVDATESYGLFMRLTDSTIFVDIREDELLEERKRHALFLFQSGLALERSLSDFIESNPVYKGREPTYIGIHSPVVDQAEVFWEPAGHTLLKGLKFVSE